MAKENLSIPRGTRDFGPQQMRVRNFIFSTIRSVFELYGFAPLETPAMENKKTLTGRYGDEGEKLIYNVVNAQDSTFNLAAELRSAIQDVKFLGNEKEYFSKVNPLITELNSISKEEKLALRYDLTVPLARYVVMNWNKIAMPFKRYQMQPVWRADRPSFGRYREFYQCDADVVGTKSLLCEVEIMQMMVAVMQKLGIDDFMIKINHRKILAGLAAFCGAPGREAEMSVSLDKLDKVDWSVVEEELLRKEFSSSFVSKLKDLLTGIVSFESTTYSQTEAELQADEQAKKGFADLNEIAAALQAFPEVGKHLRFDLTLARGLSYYTGPIFEIVPQGVKVGSISGGGRYDELTSVFGMDGIAGVGFSFGIDRIYDLLIEKGKLESMAPSATQVLIVQFNKSDLPHYLKLASDFRAAGIATEIYPDEAKLKKQFAYADSKQIPWVVVLGEDELKENKLMLKQLSKGTQDKLNFDEAVFRINS